MIVDVVTISLTVWFYDPEAVDRAVVFQYFLDLIHLKLRFHTPKKNRVLEIAVALSYSLDYHRRTLGMGFIGAGPEYCYCNIPSIFLPPQ
ncbi:MAG TPA: hypothetical protein VLX29_07980 [Nitrospirota bacterium]|nr:hypothetical protein [Nitrospirota bacterium]